MQCHKNSWIYLTTSTYYWWLLRPTITIRFYSKFQTVAQLFPSIWFKMKRHYSHNTIVYDHRDSLGLNCDNKNKMQNVYRVRLKVYCTTWNFMSYKTDRTKTCSDLFCWITRLPHLAMCVEYMQYLSFCLGLFVDSNMPKKVILNCLQIYGNVASS